MFNLDIRTLALSTGVIYLVIGVNIAYIRKAGSSYPGFGILTLGALLTGAGMIVLGLRDILPSFLSVIIANIFIVCLYTASFLGMVYFAGQTPRLAVHAGLLAGLLLAFCYFTYFSPSVNARIILISVFMAFYCLMSLLLLLRSEVGSYLRNTLLIWIFGATGVLCLFRAGYTGLFEQSLASFMRAGTFHMIAIVLYNSSGFMILIGILFMGLARRRWELEEARKEVRELSGLLPICASCKKIRNDEGYWTQIEEYIHQHSGADFTHGICPECAPKFYPDSKIYKDKKPQG